MCSRISTANRDGVLSDTQPSREIGSPCCLLCNEQFSIAEAKKNLRKLYLIYQVVSSPKLYWPYILNKLALFNIRYITIDYNNFRFRLVLILSTFRYPFPYSLFYFYSLKIWIFVNLAQYLTAITLKNTFTSITYFSICTIIISTTHCTIKIRFSSTILKTASMSIHHHRHHHHHFTSIYIYIIYHEIILSLHSFLDDISPR